MHKGEGIQGGWSEDSRTTSTSERARARVSGCYYRLRVGRHRHRHWGLRGLSGMEGEGPRGAGLNREGELLV